MSEVVEMQHEFHAEPTHTVPSPEHTSDMKGGMFMPEQRMTMKYDENPGL